MFINPPSCLVVHVHGLHLNYARYIANKIINNMNVHLLLEPQVDQLPCFSNEELKKFEARYENGYDLKHDERYNLWVKHFHSSKG